MSPTRQQYRAGARDSEIAVLAFDAESERHAQQLAGMEIDSFNALVRACERRGIPTFRACNTHDLRILLGIVRDLDRLSELLWGEHDDELCAAMV